MGVACPCGAEAAPSSGSLPSPLHTATPWVILRWDIPPTAVSLAEAEKWLVVLAVVAEEDPTNQIDSSLILSTID